VTTMRLDDLGKSTTLESNKSQEGYTHCALRTPRSSPRSPASWGLGRHPRGACDLRAAGLDDVRPAGINQGRQQR